MKETYPFFNSNFSRTIKKWNIKINDLANMFGVSRQTLHLYTKTSVPSHANLIQFIKLTGYDYYKIFTEDLTEDEIVKQAITESKSIVGELESDKKNTGIINKYSFLNIFYILYYTNV